MNKINRVILCIIDDVRAGYFFNFINKGMLPNFKKLMENGIYSNNCVTDFPSITYPTQVSIITGTYTGDYHKEPCHGVPLYNWMGRDESPPILRCYGSNRLEVYKLNRDIGVNCRTLLEMVGEGNTTSITQFINRGSNYFYPDYKMKLILYYLLLKYTRNIKKTLYRLNTWAVYKLLETFKKPKKFFGDKEPPIASLLWFPSSDILLHMFGSDSKQYKLNLIHIDKVFGILVNELKKLGYLYDTAIAVTTDHGNYKASKVGDLSLFFEHNGLTHYHPRNNLKGNVNLAEFGGVGFFNFKSSENLTQDCDWTRPTIAELENYGPKRINLFDKLFQIEGSQLMYYRDDDNSHKRGKIYLKRKDKSTGKTISGTIEYQGTGLEYKTKYLFEGNEDIFSYINDSLASKCLDNKFHSTQEWMEATYKLDYPMYPDLIPRHFKNPRSSDIIVSNDGNIVFNIEHGRQKNKNMYSHDLGLRTNAIVPLIIGGSEEISKKEIKCCKSTDIVPTLLKMLGKKPHKSVVGEALI